MEYNTVVSNFEEISKSLVIVRDGMLALRDNWNTSVRAFKSINEMRRDISALMRSHIKPFDVSESEKFDVKNGVSDEEFLINVSSAIQKKSGLSRCSAISTIIGAVCEEYDSMVSKRDKMSECAKMIRPPKSNEDAVLLGQYETMIKKMNANIVRYENMLELCYKKYFAQRKANLNRQLGIDESVYSRLKKSGIGIDISFFRFNDIASIFESIKRNDASVIKERKMDARGAEK